jgi:putative addiction module component (TIGR02574 family)
MAMLGSTGVPASRGSPMLNPMRRSVAEILQDALELPVEARAALAGSLIESLDEEVDEDAEEQWSAEIARSVDEVDRGEVKLVPWNQIRRRLLDG